MTNDILTSVSRTLIAMGTRLQTEDFSTIRSAYLLSAQDAIRQYAADAIMNCLQFDRHQEEVISESFAQQVISAGQVVHQDPTGSFEIPNWSRVLSAFPDLPQKMREIVKQDRKEFTALSTVQKT